jgi:hypothetical protein
VCADQYYKAALCCLEEAVSAQVVGSCAGMLFWSTRCGPLTTGCRQTARCLSRTQKLLLMCFARLFRYISSCVCTELKNQSAGLSLIWCLLVALPGKCLPAFVLICHPCSIAICSMRLAPAKSSCCEVCCGSVMS